MIKVLIVDDSPYIRRILTDMLNEDEEIQVVGSAINGKEALEKIPILKPDIITLDIQMPIMDGITALEKIIDIYNIPVIMISSYTKEGADLTLDALERGAVDFIPKPEKIFGFNGKLIALEIINKIKMVAKSVSGVKHDMVMPSIEYQLDRKSKSDSLEYIIAVGSSTGGPRALQSVLPLLPKDLNAAIVVVQHMPPRFTQSLANRLDSLSSIKIKEGEEGDRLKRSHCYIAPGDFYMEVVKKNSDFQIRLRRRSSIRSINTTVNTLMQSVAELDDLKKIGIVMTGMGTDGADGIVQIKKSQGFTIAQDEASSVVFGMPKSAINTKHVDKIVSLENIASEIISRVGV